VWDFVAGDAAPFMVTAVRALGPQVLAGAGDSTTAADRETVGRQLLRLVFGTRPGEDLPGPVAGLARDPESKAAQAELFRHVDDAFEADPGMASAAADLIARYHRLRAEGGNAAAYEDLGDLLYWEDFAAARAAYQQAINAGHPHAMISLAKLLHAHLHDEQASLDMFAQALNCADPDIAAEAMVQLAWLRAGHRDDAGARAWYERAISTGQPRWAAEATLSQAMLMLRHGDLDQAEALYRQATASPDLGERFWQAWYGLGEVRHRKGDAPGAKAAWRRVIDSGSAQWAGAAVTELAQLLEQEQDVGGLRALYEQAAARGIPDAPYALVTLGQTFDARGDTQSAQAAWQQAIDAGYEYADELREQMSPPQEPDGERDADDGPADLPPQLDPRNMARTGIDVLDHGLPALPDALSHQMAIPIAYWKADSCAVVLVLRYSRHGRGKPEPVAVQVTYARTAAGWAPHSHCVGTSFSHDPIARPGSLYDLSGQAMTYSATSGSGKAAPGRPAFIAVGRAAPQVKYLAVIQHGQEDRRPLDSRFGAWVICTDQPGPLQVRGIDSNGKVLASIDFSRHPPRVSEAPGPRP
jgi:tetratricopeptide (TPR) repeat protein